MSYAPLSFKAATTISAYRVVKMHSVGQTVALADTVTAYPLGITTDTVKDTTQAIPVAVSGIAKLQFNDSVAVGGLVAVDANGLGIPAVATTAGIYVVGVLVGNKVNATGTLGDVLINPFQLQIP